MLKLKKKAIGIFGGSFDPPHKGHVQISKISLKKLNLKKIYWVITKKNPFKNKAFFSLSERIKKSKIITNKEKKIKIKFFEDKIKSSNTIDLIRHLKKKNSLFLIIGSDNLIKFHKWKNWKLLSQLSKITVFSRKDYDKKAKKSVTIKQVKTITFIKNKPINISSSQIRKNYLKN